jgi:hypothetical protein
MAIPLHLKQRFLLLASLINLQRTPSQQEMSHAFLLLTDLCLDLSKVFM